MRKQPVWTVRAGLFVLGCGGIGATAIAADADSGHGSDSELSEVVVTGIRSSVQHAQDIKRTAPSVVEAVTTEDLGKFTDANIADALQRVPGVNIERSSGTFDAGYGITIRGLGEGFSTSTLNGRDLLGIPDFFGNGGRQFDFQTVPPEVLSGVTIYKTSTASMVEPGLSGQVNMQTLRPLDYKVAGGGQYFGSTTIQGSKATRTKDKSPRAGVTLGGKFLDDTLGAYVAGLYSNDWADRDLLEHYAGRTSFSLTDGRQFPNTLVNQFGYDIWRAHEERTKRSIASGVQWKPNSNLDVNGDFEFNKSGIIRRDQADYWYPSIGVSGFGSEPIPPDALTFGGTGPGVVGWDATKIPGLTGYSSSYLGALHIDYINRSYNGGLNALWKTDDQRLQIGGDLAHSNTDYTISWLHPYIDNGTTSTYREQVSAGGARPVITETNVGDGPDHSSVAAYQAVTYAENFQKRNRGERNAARLDLQYAFNDIFTGKVGTRYARTNTKFISMAIYNSQLPTVVQGGLDNNAVNHLPFITWATPVVDFYAFCANNPTFCGANNFGRGSMTGPFPTTAAGSPDDVIGLNTGESYAIRETNTAYYGQLDFADHVDGMPASGNLGVRAVRITEDGLAFQGYCTKTGFDSNPCNDGSSVTQRVEDRNSYWEYLPSVNLSLSPRSDLNLRFAIGRSITLPTYSQLAPIGKADIIVPDANGTRLGNNIASTGNTRLKPTKAWNYDFTTEFYTDYGGAYIGSLFYKRVQDLIITTTLSQVKIPGQGDLLFDSTTSENAATGKTYGLELGTNQPLTFLPEPWSGFGVQANYTYVVSKTTVSGTETQFPGSSKNNANLQIYFEKFGYSARVAYSYRSQYLSSFGDGNKYTRAMGRLDASVSKTFGSYLELILAAENITGVNRSIYDQTAGFVASYYEQPAVYTVGLRAHF